MRISEITIEHKKELYLEYVLNKVNELIEKYDNKETTNLSKALKENSIGIDEFGVSVVRIYGGLNGHGLVSNYFKTLSDLSNAMEAVFEDVWLINVMNDPADDVFFVDFAIDPYIVVDIEKRGY